MIAHAVRPTLLAVAAALAMVAFSPAAGSAQEAPPFWISNLEGRRFDSREHEGPIVLSFFFVNCPPCIKEIPQLHAIMARDFPDAALLFIDPLGKEDTPQDIKAFAERLEVPLRYFYYDPLGRLAEKFYADRFIFPTIVGIVDGRTAFRVHDLSEPSVETIRAALRQ